jgi:hypothetical protein
MRPLVVSSTTFCTKCWRTGSDAVPCWVFGSTSLVRDLVHCLVSSSLMHYLVCGRGDTVSSSSTCTKCWVAASIGIVLW